MTIRKITKLRLVYNLNFHSSLPVHGAHISCSQENRHYICSLTSLIYYWMLLRMFVACSKPFGQQKAYWGQTSHLHICCFVAYYLLAIYSFTQSYADVVGIAFCFTIQTNKQRAWARSLLIYYQINLHSRHSTKSTSTDYSTMSFLLTTQWQGVSYCADYNTRENHLKLFNQKHT